LSSSSKFVDYIKKKKKMKNYIVVLVVSIFAHLLVFAPITKAQESINAQEGMEPGKQVGIALAICFSILTAIIVTINLLNRRFVSRHHH
jgi:uncharacterized membrane protein